MKVNCQRILNQCVVLGIEKGYKRSYEYGSHIDPERLKDNIHFCIMEEIREFIDFGDEDQQKTDKGSELNRVLLY